MIRNRNLSDFTETLRIPGTQATSTTNQDVTIVPFNGVIDALYAKLGTAGITGTQTTDVLLNGSSIFSGGTLLNFASGATACTYGATTNNPQKVNKGDVISLKTTAIHSGTAAKDLIVKFVFTRQRDAYSQGATQTDTIGADSDTL